MAEDRPPVSKRLRYEILRRDNYTCRYCGAAAPDVVLTVDHVVPVALGGQTDPTNLVTACKDCNAGKTSTAPDSALVADIAQDALRWAAAMQRAAILMAAERDILDRRLTLFIETWGDAVPIPDDWPDSIERLIKAGVTDDELAYATGIAFRSRVSHYKVFAYFHGVVNRLLAERREVASGLITDGTDL